MKVTGLLILLFSWLAGNSQERFYKVLPAWKSVKTVFFEDNSFLSFCQDVTPQDQVEMKFFVLNPDFEVSSVSDYHVDSVAHTFLRPSAIYSDNNNVYIGASLKIDEVTSIGALMCFDSTCQHLKWSKVLPLNSKIVITSIDKINSYFYLAGNLKSNNKYYCALYKIDTTGSIIWQKLINNGFHANEPIQMFRLSDSSHIVLQRVFDSPGESLDDVILFRINDEGQILWYKDIEENQNLYTYYASMCLLPNDEVALTWTDLKMVTSSGPHYGLNPDFSVWVSRWDRDGNRLWKKPYRQYLGFTQFNTYNRAIERDVDGNLLVGLYVVDTVYRPGLMKIDTNGNLLWKRVYDIYPENGTVLDMQTNVNHILPLGEEKGYLLSCDFMTPGGGNLFPFDYQTALIVKTDKYGCLVEGCQQNDNIVTPADEVFNLYPNPAEGRIYVQSDNLPAQAQLFDMQGKLLLTLKITRPETVVNLSGFENGIYLLKFDSGSKVETKIVVKK